MEKDRCWIQRVPVGSNDDIAHHAGHPRMIQYMVAARFMGFYGIARPCADNFLVFIDRDIDNEGSEA